MGGGGAAGKDALPCPSAKAKLPQPTSAAQDHCGLILLNLNPPRLIQLCNSVIQWKIFLRLPSDELRILRGTSITSLFSSLLFFWGAIVALQHHLKEETSPTSPKHQFSADQNRRTHNRTGVNDMLIQGSPSSSHRCQEPKTRSTTNASCTSEKCSQMYF